MSLLQINPDLHLLFRGPFNEVVTSVLTLKNISDSKVCFKVKTTAPRRYCVRPNSGIIEVGQTVEVSIMLQPFQYDPNEKNNHKFMVQSMILDPSKADVPLDDVWKGADSSQIIDKRLRCQFELPSNAAPADTATPVAPSSPAASPKAEAPVAVNNRTFLPEKPTPATSTNNSTNDRVEALVRENANLKKRVAEISSQRTAVQQQAQPVYHNAAYYIVFVIVGWLIAKFVI